jgi:excinuclease ABC subunit A
MLDTGWMAGPEKKPQRKAIEGLAHEAMRRFHHAKSDIMRRRLSRVMAHRPCRTCHGRRLKPEWLAVRIEGTGGRWLGIQDYCGLTAADALEWINGIRIDDASHDICMRLAGDVSSRLCFLRDVGLDYLTLDRSSGTLSGGEAQRIRLASQLGAGLTGVIYVLDEPSIGLHAADTERLIGALTRLRDIGNTVVIVEHDEAIIRTADHVIDMGPGAGASGGTILASGRAAELQSPTGEWLRSKAARPGAPATRRPPPEIGAGQIIIRGAREHNLQNLDVKIPLGRLVCLCGPSGSGKSTLADEILRRALARHFHGAGEPPGSHDRIEGLELIEK